MSEPPQKPHYILAALAAVQDILLDCDGLRGTEIEALAEKIVEAVVKIMIAEVEK